MTRPRLSWSDLPGRRVGLYGLGVEGHASLRACLARGITPVLVDENPSGAGDLDLPVLAPGDGGLDALTACDVVIKSPGISRYRQDIRTLEAAGIGVVGGLGLWLAETDLARVLVVTGTKGKSTTSAVAAHLIAGLGHRVMLAGNIGHPPFDPEVASETDYYIVEVSSYQATDLPVSPPVTAVTSLDPDHLPWHEGSVETYYADKLSATTQPGARVTVANGDSANLRAHRDQLGPEVRWVQADDDPGDTWMDGLGLLGAHNRRNALIARAALTAMGVPGAQDVAVLARAATGFAGLPSRLQVVGNRGGVLFVDDNLSTNVLPALAAVEAFPDRRVALLVGGQSRGIDYAPLGAGLRGRADPVLVVTMPSNGRDVHAQMAGSAGDVPIVDADSLDEAVLIAADWAEPDGVVLLSPAAPSFDLFRSYVARGEAFVSAMVACGGIGVTGQ